MEPNASIAAAAPGRFVTLLDPAVLGLVDGLGLAPDCAEELVWLVAGVPPERRVAYVLGVYDDLAAVDAEPGDDVA